MQPIELNQDLHKSEPEPSNAIKLVTTNLTACKDNILHLMSADCQSSTPINCLLRALEYINISRLKRQKPKLGQVIISPIGKFQIFTVIATERYHETIQPPKLIEILKTAAKSIDQKKITSLRVSRRGEMTDRLYPGHWRDILQEAFKNTNVQISLCLNNIEIPKPEARKEIIHNLHTSLIGGHRGEEASVKKLRERFWWPKLRADVIDYVRKCQTYQQNKIDRTTQNQREMVITEVSLISMDIVSIDTIGKLPVTPRNNAHLLTAQCHLTKYLICIPIPDLKATTIATALMKNLICCYGAPRILKSDNAPSFISAVVE